MSSRGRTSKWFGTRDAIAGVASLNRFSGNRVRGTEDGMDVPEKAVSARPRVQHPVRTRARRQVCPTRSPRTGPGVRPVDTDEKLTILQPVA